MTPEIPEDEDSQDRVVSRRVDNPTSAEPGDGHVYEAADPPAEPEPEDEGGPTRSE